MVAKCKIDGCESGVSSKGLCDKHYHRLRKYGDPLFITRRENGSGYVNKKNGLVYIYKPGHPNASKSGRIPEHIYVMSDFLGRPIDGYEYIIHKNGNNTDNSIDNLQLLSTKDKCLVKRCNALQRCSGLCDEHYRKYLAYGNVEENRRAKNLDGHINQYGYRRIWKPGHPNSNNFGTILEHRFVMSEFLGRPLSSNENVHHINGDRLDNRIENLELWTSRQPPRQRVDDLVKWARDILDRYEEENQKLQQTRKESL